MVNGWVYGEVKSSASSSGMRNADMIEIYHANVTRVTLAASSTMDQVQGCLSSIPTAIWSGARILSQRL
jgi:hypothetical protein